MAQNGFQQETDWFSDLQECPIIQQQNSRFLQQDHTENAEKMDERLNSLIESVHYQPTQVVQANICQQHEAKQKEFTEKTSNQPQNIQLHTISKTEDLIQDNQSDSIFVPCKRGRPRKYPEIIKKQKKTRGAPIKQRNRIFGRFFKPTNRQQLLKMLFTSLYNFIQKILYDTKKIIKIIGQISTDQNYKMLTDIVKQNTDEYGKILEKYNTKNRNEWKENVRREFGKDDNIGEIWIFWIDLIFKNKQPDSLCKQFKIRCCQQYHSDQCRDHWKKLQKYLRQEFLREISYENQLNLMEELGMHVSILKADLNRKYGFKPNIYLPLNTLFWSALSN